MALMRGKPSEIPADAIRMTEEEAIEHQWDVLGEHQDDSIFSAFRFGPGVLGAMGAATGMLVNNHYRSRLRLGKYGYIGSYVPIAVLPAIMGTFFHRGIVQTRILLEKDKCPLCLQLRAAAVQAFFGTVYPTVLAPLAAYMFAVRHYTYRLPSITAEPLAVARVYLKMTRPIVPALAVAIGLHALAASYITYREQMFYAVLQVKLREEAHRERQNLERGSASSSLGERDERTEQSRGGFVF